MENNTPEKKYYEFTDIKNQKKYQVEKSSSSYEPLNGKLDILNFDPNQFKQVYYNEIAPILLAEQSSSSSEKEGLSLTKTVCWLLMIGGGYFVIMLFIAAFTEKQADKRLAALIFGIIFLCSHIGVSSFMLFSVRKVDRYSLKERFFSFFNAKYSRYTHIERDYNKANIYTKALSEDFYSAMKKIAVSSVKFTTDEGLTIPYNGKTLEFLELNARIGSKSRLLVSYFINKKFKGETIVKPIKEAKKTDFVSKQEVYLEDSVFNKNFKIFADDQVEARYLLTTAFIERLLGFQMTHNCIISVLFSNNVSKKSNIFLCIDFGKDFFELPKSKGWIYDSSHFYKICKEIREIAEILAALKLDQDIGM